MRKYALIFCFLIILLFSNEIPVEQFNQYYDYAVLLLRGLSGKNKTDEQLCGEYLEKNKKSLSPLFKEIIEKFQNNTLTFLEFMFKYYTPLQPVDSVCDILTLLGIYLNFKDNDNEQYRIETLRAIGQSLAKVIDFSVD